MQLTRLTSLLLHWAKSCSTSLMRVYDWWYLYEQAILQLIWIDLKLGMKAIAAWTNWQNFSNCSSASSLVAQTAKEAMAVLWRPVTWECLPLTFSRLWSMKSHQVMGTSWWGRGGTVGTSLTGQDHWQHCVWTIQNVPDGEQSKMGKVLEAPGQTLHIDVPNSPT